MAGVSFLMPFVHSGVMPWDFNTVTSHAFFGLLTWWPSALPKTCGVRLVVLVW